MHATHDKEKAVAEAITAVAAVAVVAGILMLVVRLLAGY